MTDGRVSSRDPKHEQVGPYRLLELIGAGGKGEVYLAEQQTPVHRRVAIKIIKRGMDTNQVIARFESDSHTCPNHGSVFRLPPCVAGAMA